MLFHSPSARSEPLRIEPARDQGFHGEYYGSTPPNLVVLGVVAAAVMAASVMLAGGCDFLSKKASEVKKAASETTQHVVERAKQETNTPAESSWRWRAGAPLKTSGCYGTLTIQGGGRPTVFQVTSYADAAGESFPSLHFSAATSADSTAALANQTLQGRLYFQQQPDGPVWHTADGDMASLSIQSAADDQFTATLAQCKLVNTESNETRMATGTFSGSLK